MLGEENYVKNELNGRMGFCACETRGKERNSVMSGSRMVVVTPEDVQAS